MYRIRVYVDEVDEFMLQVMMEYKGKKFKSISQGDLDLISEGKLNDVDLDLFVEDIPFLLQQVLLVYHIFYDRNQVLNRIKINPLIHFLFYLSALL